MPSTQPIGETTALLWVRGLDPRDLTLTLPRTKTHHRNLSLPRTLTLQLSRHLEWTLTSAIEGGHETGVDSALVTYLD